VEPEAAGLDRRHVRAFAYFAGAARQTVSDNLKAGIIKACFHEPTVQSDLCRHGAALPHRHRSGAPYKPRDKAKVEVGVQVVGRWILARLRQPPLSSRWPNSMRQFVRCSTISTIA